MIDGTLIGDRFELHEVAGRGGMATVYRATDRSTGATVALKVLAGATSNDAARFEREASVLAELAHPNIVGYLGRGTLVDGRAYLAIEWLVGDTLAARLAESTPTLLEAVKLVQTLAGALGHAHDAGVVHRDVKPSNVFLVGPGFGDVRLLDFGVARLLEGSSAMTRTGTALGTPAYMAPEQARGARSVDARVDVYALGCVLFECVFGQAPFTGDDVMAVLAKVLFEEAPRMSARLRNVPASLDDLCAMLLEKDPDARPANGRTVAAMLELVVDDLTQAGSSTEVVTTRPPRPLSVREQRLVAVVAIAPEGYVGGARESARTLAADSVVPAIDLGRAATRLDARFSSLADGSAIAVLEGAASATDLALRAARCALAFRQRCPSLPIALVMGRALANAQIPVGEIIDRVADTIRATIARGEPFVLRLDELAASLLESRFEIDCDDAGPILRGERETPRPARLLHGKETPFVGRSRELRMLEALYDECKDDGIACVSLVTGAAGVGKTRLIAEWLARTSLADEAVVWLGRGDPISAGSPLGLLRSLLRTAARLTPGEPDAVAEQKLLAWASLHMRDSAQRVATFFADLLAVESCADPPVELVAARSDPTLMGDQLRRAFEDVTHAVASAAPLVIVLEDAHWGDAASLRFIDAALRHAKALPLFVVVVGRPELAVSLPSLTATQSALHISVGELSRKVCEQFVEAALGGKVEPPVLARVVEQSGGNIYFLEELVRSVAEGRLGELPATVIAMVQSRLEALPGGARRVLRAASVFGISFWPDAIAHLLGETTSSGATGAHAGAVAADAVTRELDLLCAQELVETTPSSRFSGKRELKFRQAIVRDAAYEMLTDRDRSSGHRLAAEWLERAGERDAMALGEHLERAGAQQKAARFWSSAAERALDAHDFTMALRLVERARAGVTDGGTSLGELLLIEGEALRWKGDMAGAERAASDALAVLAPGTEPWFVAAHALAALAGVGGDFRAAVVLRDRLLAVRWVAAAASARLLALSAVGRRLFHLGDYDSAREIIDLVTADARALPPPLDPRMDAEIARLRGASARHGGDVAGDLSGYRAALDAFERAGDVRGGCNARISVAFALIQLGAYVDARAELMRAIEEARRLGLPNVETRAHQNLALVEAAEGDYGAALATGERVAAEAKSRGDERFEAWTRIYLSRFAYGAGDFERARREAELASDRLAATPPAYAGALAALALALLALDERLEAELKATEAMAILAEYDGIEEFEALVQRAAIETARAVGDREHAATLARDAALRLRRRAEPLVGQRYQRSFLEDVADNAAIIAAAQRA